MIDLSVRPRETITFETFTTLPGPAVALDGYVIGPSRFEAAGPHVNFNHHEGVNRLGTRATCEQVAIATRAGIWDVLGDRANVYVNDCDADVCLSTWLLENPDRVNEPNVDLLVCVEGSLDATGGCVSSNSDDDILDQMTWVFEPYNQWRHHDGDSSAAGIADVINEVGARITAFADGTGGRARHSDDYRIIQARGPICAVEEYGPLARMRMHRDGVKIFVSSRQSGGRTVVSIGKAWPYTPVDLGLVYRDLNLLEGCIGLDRWGGSDLIGGSPRETGTQLPISLILDVIAEHWTGPRDWA